MKIAVPNRRGFISPQLNQFTRYSIFTINDNKANLISVLDLSKRKNYRDIALALCKEGVEVTLVDRIGHRAYESFVKHRLKVIPGYKGSIASAVEKYMARNA